MASNLLDFLATSSTQITMTAGSSQFYPILNVKGQVGIAFQTVGASGAVEIAGGGVSYAPAGTSFTYMNSNGSSLQLKANGTGFPICQQPGIYPPLGFYPGAPVLWLTTGNSVIMNVIYFLNDGYINQ